MNEQRFGDRSDRSDSSISTLLTRARGGRGLGIRHHLSLNNPKTPSEQAKHHVTAQLPSVTKQAENSDG
jgi:hypothetical protein